jgi:hypothetical protein
MSSHNELSPLSAPVLIIATPTITPTTAPDTHTPTVPVAFVMPSRHHGSRRQGSDCHVSRNLKYTAEDVSYHRRVGKSVAQEVRVDEVGHIKALNW